MDVRITHPETGGTADVPESSLPHYYASGWRLAGEEPERGDAPEPGPAESAQAADASPDSEERP